MDALVVLVLLVGGWLVATGLALVLARVSRRADEVGPDQDAEAMAPPDPRPERPTGSERSRAA